MVSLEQIRILENKITKACELISVLRKENATLKRAVESSQTRMGELELFINQFKTEQVEIESGIVNVLRKLDELEDGVSDAKNMQDREGDLDSKKAPKQVRNGAIKEKKADTLAPDLYDNDTDHLDSDKTILRDSGTGANPEEKVSATKHEAELDIF